jgi:putative PEP-CTERM system histidine kinase
MLASIAGTMAFAFLSVLALVAWARKIANRWLLIACISMTLLLLARAATGDGALARALETFAVLSWVLVVAESIGLGFRRTNSDLRLLTVRRLCIVSILVGATSIALDVTAVMASRMSASLLSTAAHTLDLLLAVAGLVLLEQMIRNVREEQRWRTRYIEIALGGLFFFQFVFNASAVLFPAQQPYLMTAQPIMFLLVTPLLAIGIRRASTAPMAVSLSRDFVFRSGVLIASGALLMGLSVLAYLATAFGGSWGLAALTLLIALVGMGLAVVLGSSRVRIRGRQFLARHVFQRKFDYQREWERVTERLTEPSADYDLGQQVIRVLGRVVDSEGGAVWTLTSAGNLIALSRLRCAWDRPVGIETTQLLSNWFANRGHMLDLNRFTVGLDPGITALKDTFSSLRFLVPLHAQERLVGIVGLTNPLMSVAPDWEDLELLRLVARQSASFVALQQAERAVSESSALSSFNQIAAFIVHDAKTISAQLSLLLANAEKHKHKPAFIDDMLGTVDNSVQRLHRLLEHMRAQSAGTHATDGHLPVDLTLLLPNLLRGYQNEQLTPKFSYVADAAVADRCMVKASESDLRSAIGHIVQNAVDAATVNDSVSTGPSVEVVLRSGAAWHEVLVRDNGSGMDAAFIRDRLFQPGVTTKGVSGMGVGAYQARIYVRAIGGDIAVNSELDHGTEFVIRLPAAGTKAT